MEEEVEGKADFPVEQFFIHPNQPPCFSRVTPSIKNDCGSWPLEGRHARKVNQSYKEHYPIRFSLGLIGTRTRRGTPGSGLELPFPFPVYKSLPEGIPFHPWHSLIN